MIRCLGTAILIFCASLLVAQSTGNPFDLQFRPIRPASAPQPVIPPSSTDTVSAGMMSESPVLPTPEPKDTAALQHMVPGSDTASVTPTANPFELRIEMDSSEAAVSAPVITDPGKSIPDIVPTVLRKKSSKGFQVFFVLLSLLLLIFIVNVERSFVRDLWRVISNENYSSLHLRNQRNTMRQILLMMGYAIFVLQTGLFLFHALQVLGHNGPILVSIWTCIALVLGVYLIRHIVIRYLKWLFNNEKEMTLFGFDISIFNIMVGLILLPINIFLLFGPESIVQLLVYLGIGVIGSAYLLRQFRWLLTARHLISSSLFLFFVYLCAVEILPLWVVSSLFW